MSTAQASLQFMKPKAFREIFGLTPLMMRKMLKTGEVRCVRMARQITRIPVTEVERFAAQAKARVE
jgi:predicted site-specific integrase-resolvase